jgi:hypothetical protein
MAARADRHPLQVTLSCDVTYLPEVIRKPQVGWLLFPFWTTARFHQESQAQTGVRVCQSTGPLPRPFLFLVLYIFTAATVRNHKRRALDNADPSYAYRPHYRRLNTLFLPRFALCDSSTMFVIVYVSSNAR